MIDFNYKTLVQKVYTEGNNYEDPKRKGVIRRELPSYTFVHDFEDGFPAITLKKLEFKTVLTELIWFLTGNPNIKYLVDNNCNIWNKDAYNFYIKCCKIHTPNLPIKDMNTWLLDIKESVIEKQSGDLGLIYPYQWRYNNGKDPIEEILKLLKETPMSSEMVLNAWQTGQLEYMALPPCHYGFQIVGVPLPNSKTGYGFELHWNQRSCDVFLGIPFNIASYGLLALIFEGITGHKALKIEGRFSKVHLYNNSFEAVEELLNRKCSEEISTVDLMIDSENLDYVLSKLDQNKSKIKLNNYNPYPPLRVEMLSRDE